MVRRLLALICAVSAWPALAQVRWQPAGAVRFEADCSLSTLNCGSGNVCVDNFGGVGNARWFICDPAADGGLGNFIPITNAGGGGGGPAFGTIGTAVADIGGDTLSVNDSSTIDFTTADNPESLTAAVIQSFAYAWTGGHTWTSSSFSQFTRIAEGTAATLILSRDPGTPSVDDENVLSQQLEDAAGNQYTGIQLSAVPTDLTDGSEDADIRWNVIRNGSLAQHLRYFGSTGIFSFGPEVNENRDLVFNRLTNDGTMRWDGTDWSFLQGGLVLSQAGALVDGIDVGAHAHTGGTGGAAINFSSLGGAASKAQIPAAVAYEDEANTFASAGTQTFSDPVNIRPDGTNGWQVDAAGSLIPSGTTGLFVLPASSTPGGTRGVTRVAASGTGAFYYDTAERQVAITGSDIAGSQAGSCTFAAGISCTVSLPVAEIDATYLVRTSCSGSWISWVTGKSTTQFVINASTSNSDSCDWEVSR